MMLKPGSLSRSTDRAHPRRGPLRVAALVAAVTVVSAAPSPSGSAAEGSSILHVYSAGAKGEICLVDPSTAERRCLTDNRRFDLDPVWSPDGTRIAFVQQTNEPRNPDIYVMDADGTDKQRLTRSPRDDDDPQWSPDGTQILWNRNRGDTPTGKLMVMDADGGNKHPLTDGERDDVGAVWSPSGAEIVFMSRNPCYTGACANHQFDLHVVNADGTGERNLTQSDADESGPEWSPDGSRVAFVRPLGEGSELYLINSDGTGETQLTDTPEADFLPAWSPDGEEIAFTQITDVGNFNTRLAVVDVGTREVRVLTTDEVGGVEPTWSPDGAFIAFSGHRSLGRTASYEIHSIRSDGTELRRLTRTPGDESFLDWR